MAASRLDNNCDPISLSHKFRECTAVSLVCFKTDKYLLLMVYNAKLTLPVVVLRCWDT